MCGNTMINNKNNKEAAPVRGAIPSANPLHSNKSAPDFSSWVWRLPAAKTAAVFLVSSSLVGCATYYVPPPGHLGELVKKGNARAEYVLGVRESLKGGEAIQSAAACDAAVYWWKKSASQGYAPAEVQVGAYLSNQAVLPGANPYVVATGLRCVSYPLHPAAARHYFERAAVQYKKAAYRGEPSAEYGLGMLYYLGDGVHRNLDKAVTWYKKAAAQGYAAADISLAEMSTSLENPYYPYSGVSQESINAGWTLTKTQALALARRLSHVHWYKRAAAAARAAPSKNLWAEYALSSHYRVPGNTSEEFYWAKMAADYGYVPAMNRYQSLREQYTADRQAELQAQAKARARWKLIHNPVAAYNRGSAYFLVYSTALRDYNAGARLAMEEGLNGPANYLAPQSPLHWLRDWRRHATLWLKRAAADGSMRARRKLRALAYLRKQS